MADSAMPHTDPSGGRAPALHFPLPTPLDSSFRWKDEFRGAGVYFRTNHSCQLAPARQSMKMVGRRRCSTVWGSCPTPPLLERRVWEPDCRQWRLFSYRYSLSRTETTLHLYKDGSGSGFRYRVAVLTEHLQVIENALPNQLHGFGGGVSGGNATGQVRQIRRVSVAGRLLCDSLINEHTSLVAPPLPRALSHSSRHDSIGRLSAEQFLYKSVLVNFQVVRHIAKYCAKGTHLQWVMAWNRDVVLITLVGACKSDVAAPLPGDLLTVPPSQ